MAYFKTIEFVEGPFTHKHISKGHHSQGLRPFMHTYYIAKILDQDHISQVMIKSINS